MALSVFDDKEHEPRDTEVAEARESTYALWENLKSQIATQFDPLSVDWGFAGKNYGWSLRLKQKKRTVLYMTPRPGHFLVGFALGEKAVNAAHQSDLRKSALDIIDGAKKYAEGRGVRIEVRRGEDILDVVKIATIKMAN